MEDPFKDQLELNASFNGNKKEYVGLFDRMLTTFNFFEDAQTNIEFSPLYPKVDWGETTYQEKYPFRSKAIVGGIVEKGATVTTSKLYKDVSEDLVEGFL